MDVSKPQDLEKRSTAFDQRLESLRGIAALAVVITHCLAALPVDGRAAFWSLNFCDHSGQTLALFAVTALLNAGSAVILFFVLSGLVLGLSVQKQTAYSWIGPYAVRRIFRLLPPMWTSILVAWLLLALVPITSYELFTDWFKAAFPPVSTVQVAKNAVLLDFQVNSVTWTMYVELIGSAAVPLLVWLSAKRTMVQQSILLVLLCAISAATPRNWTLDYLCCFQAGVMMALNPNYSLISRPRLSVTLGFALFVLQRCLFGSAVGSIMVNLVGSILVIQGIRCGAADQLLKHKWLSYLGRVSYSLYLYHTAVVYLLSVVLSRLLAANLATVTVLTVICIPISLAAAEIGYRFIELPSMAMGKRVALWIVSLGSPSVIGTAREKPVCKAA